MNGKNGKQSDYPEIALVPYIKPNTREKQPPPNSDAPHPAPDIVIKPPTKKIPMPRNIPTP